MGFHLLLVEWPILVLAIKGWDLDAVSSSVLTHALSPLTMSIDVFELLNFSLVCNPIGVPQTWIFGFDSHRFKACCKVLNLQNGNAS